MLNSVTCTNFKKLRDRTFTFTEGLNVICGDNFQGKTTLTQAVAFALFGVKALPGDSKKIPTWGEKNCKVVIDMDGYTIERTLTNCKIYKGAPVKDNLEATGNAVCSAYVEKNITGTDLRGFKILNWSAQFQTAALLTMGAAQLQRDVEKFSGVDFIDSMVKYAGNDLRDLQRDVQLFESQGTVKQLKKKIGALESDLEDSLREEAEMKANGEAILSSLNEAEGSLERAEEQNRKFHKAESRMVQLRTQIDSGNDQLEKLKAEADEVDSQLDGMTTITGEQYAVTSEELNDIAEQNVAVGLKREHAARLNQELEGIEDKIARDRELQDAIDACKILHDDRQADKSNAMQKSSTASLKVDELEESISSGVCSKCGQSIADEGTLEQYREDLKVAEADLVEAQQDAIDASKKYSAAKALYDEADSQFDEHYGDWANRRDRIMDERTSVNGYLSEHDIDDSVDEKRAELQRQFGELKKREQLELRAGKIDQEIGELMDNRNAYEAELVKVGKSAGELIGEKKITKLKLSCKKLRSDREESTEYLHKLGLDITCQRGGLTDLNHALKLEKANREKMAEAKSLNDFVQFLKDSRVTFLSQIWGNILAVASGFLMRATDGNITALTKSDKEGFMFCEDGVYAPVSSASGAQNAFIGVAVRIGLAKSLRGSSELVVLDEPTESMREENALRLSGSLLGQGQILLVTHRESDKISASNVIEV